VPACPVVRVAHRGASGLYPENTLLAFERAIALGVDAIELDVHLTRDGELAVIHDDRLGRTTNGSGWVRDHTAAELRALDAGLGQVVPMLGEVLSLAEAAGVRLCVEAKGENEAECLPIAEAVVAALAHAGWTGRAILTAFVPGALRRARALEPRLATMLDPWPQDGSLSPRQLCEQTLAAGANSLSYDHSFVTQAVAEECRLSGLALWPWAPNTAADMRRLLDLGVPGIETDRPDILNQVLRAS
jgi:glycerophosphoryl diester phosphodiesterase